MPRTHTHLNITLTSEAMLLRIAQEGEGSEERERKERGETTERKVLSEIKFQASELRKSVSNSKESKEGSLLLGSIFFPKSSINNQTDDAHLTVQFIQAMAPQQLTETAAIINASHIQIRKPFHLVVHIHKYFGFQENSPDIISTFRLNHLRQCQ